ncbi:hypothetical protein LINGRAHAP2_LOCUS16810 [Linum grandiflorum]
MENAGNLSAASFLRLTGSKFTPTESELVEHLYNYIHGILTPNQCYPVQVSDLYGDKEPWELWKDHQINSHSDVYLFTRLKKKNANFVRRIGNAGGTWHGETAETTCIPGFRGRKDGLMWAVKKSMFTYRNQKLGSEHGKWKLCEFRIGNFDTAVCRLWNNGSPTAAAEKKSASTTRKRNLDEIMGCIGQDRRRPGLIPGHPLEKLHCHRKQSSSSAPIMVEENTTPFGDAIVPFGNETTPFGDGSSLLEESSVFVPWIHRNETTPLQEFGVEFHLPEKETTPLGDVRNSETMTMITLGELFGDTTSKTEAEIIGDDVNEVAPTSYSLTTHCDIGAILDDALATEAPRITNDRQGAIRPGKDGVMMRVDKHDQLKEDDFQQVGEDNMLKQPWCTPPLLVEEEYRYFKF